MGIVGIRELSRRTSKVIEEVERTGRPVLVTRHGKPAVALVLVDAEELEDFILAHAPEFVKGMRAADRELAKGKTRPLSAMLTDLEGDRG